MSRQDGELYYWKGKGEVDLLCRKGYRTDSLVQICYEIDDLDVFEREVRALEEAGTVYRKARRTLVVERPRSARQHAIPESVKLLPLWRFLLDDVDS
jgi:predicted AAA+ superfamily ATPase